MALETRLAAGHWDRVANRDVLATYNLTTLDELRALAPAFDWPGWIGGLGATESAFAEVLVRQPSYLAALSEALAEVPLDDWKVWLTFHLVHEAAPYLSSSFVEQNFDFYSRTLTGAEEMRDRGSAASSLCDGALGEAVGERVRGARVPARGQGPDGRAGRQPGRGLPHQHRPARLDGRGHRGPSPGQARPVPPQDRLPGALARLLGARDRA